MIDKYAYLDENYSEPEKVRCPLPRWYYSPVTMRLEAMWVDCGRTYCEKCRNKEKIKWVRQMEAVVTSGETLYCVRVTDEELKAMGEFAKNEDKTSYPVEGGRMVFTKVDPSAFGIEEGRAQVVDRGFVYAEADSLFKVNDLKNLDTRRSSGKLLSNLFDKHSKGSGSKLEVVEVTAFEAELSEDEIRSYAREAEEGCNLEPETWEEAKVMAEKKMKRLLDLFGLLNIGFRKVKMKISFDPDKFKPYKKASLYGLNSGDDLESPPEFEKELVCA